ncbi:hypothetical protein [Undibacterium baiyunense]|uniref:Uncharacterized protein n=1 Tax=Undibacterium baiyunense TaxID=2828731 RepID=A0A941DDM7_9BURK|nr:hypothetical protein [Undibacterium baiyunense]MBR7745037.1 hypothetical protein [Undibacterium baiyunense]
MISANIYFFNDSNSLMLVNCLLQLPESIRPLYFSDSDRKIPRKNLLSDLEKFQEFALENKTGFFLHSRNGALFNITIRSIQYSEISMDLTDVRLSNLIPDFFLCLAVLNPFFGYACDINEYEHRNRYFKKIGHNNIEDWLGRDLNKYLPGLYWHTLLSSAAIERYRLPFDQLISEAKRVISVNSNSLHELVFYDDATEWRENVDKLDVICKNTENIFSIRSVEALLEKADNFDDYDELVSRWR